MTDWSVTCGWCGTEIDGVTLGNHDDECDPHCLCCGEQWDSKADAVDHDCPERGDAPTEDRVPESERLAERDCQRRADGRARNRRLGLR